MAVAAVIVALLLLLSAVMTAAHDAAFSVTVSHVRTLGEEGFDGAVSLARVRDAEDAVQASVRVVTQAINLTAITSIVIKIYTGAAGSATVSNFTYAPAPGAIALLGVAGLAGLRRRR